MEPDRIGTKQRVRGTYKDVFSDKEIRSLLYYQNSCANISLADDEKDLKKFYSIENAYEVINMLLFDDISSEQARLCAEKRMINQDILNNMSELLEVYCNLYSAICKYTYLIRKESAYTYRDDRYCTYIHMNMHKFNESFLSTTLNTKKKKNSFQKKDRLTFFEFQVDSKVECLNMNDVLGEKSKYFNEREILFPPFLSVELKEMEMTATERTLKGVKNESLYGKYLVVFKESNIFPKALTEEDKKELLGLRELILDPSAIKNAKIVWNQIKESSNKELNIGAIKYYLEWKRNLQLYIKKCYSAIKWEILSFKGRESVFRNDLQTNIKIANKKRKKYERRLQIVYLLEILFGVLAGVFLTLDAIGYESECLKTKAVCALGMVAFLAGISRVFSIAEKLYQRTDIFLRYDELETKWKYEKLKSPENLNNYIKKMIDISLSDNLFCKEYTEKNIKGMHKWETRMEELSESNK